jgi:hypothetical protein
MRELSPVAVNVSAPEPYVPGRAESDLASLTATSTTSAAGSTLTPLIEGRIAVQAVQCRNDSTPFATIELSKLPERFVGMQTDTLLLEPSDGTVLISALGITARQASWDCFGLKDLTVTPDGDLKVVSEHPITVTALEDPPRLLIAPAPAE